MGLFDPVPHDDGGSGGAQQDDDNGYGRCALRVPCSTTPAVTLGGNQCPLAARLVSIRFSTLVLVIVCIHYLPARPLLKLAASALCSEARGILVLPAARVQPSGGRLSRCVSAHILDFILNGS